MLALLGGVVGLLVAAVSLELLKHEPLPYQHLFMLVRLNGRLLFYGLFLALASSILFGLIPAIELLREQHFGAMARARRKWFQNIYIVGQVSAAMLLLVLTGLLLKSLKAVQALQPGFDPRDLTTAFVIKPAANQNAFFNRLLSGLRSSPGVQSAALAFSVPFSGYSPTRLFDIKGHHAPGEPEWRAEAYQVSPAYFETLRIPLLRGRLISESDTADAPPVCVIDSSLAKRFFRNEDPIGQAIEHVQWRRSNCRHRFRGARRNTREHFTPGCVLSSRADSLFSRSRCHCPLLGACRICHPECSSSG
jgi:putative ABC transport system permease protein